MCNCKCLGSSRGGGGGGDSTACALGSLGSSQGLRVPGVHWVHPTVSAWGSLGSSNCECLGFIGDGSSRGYSTVIVGFTGGGGHSIV